MKFADTVRTTVLPSGVTVITDYYPVSEVLCAELVFPTGSLHDPEHQNGLAHFAEHMFSHACRGKTPTQLNELARDWGVIDHNLGTGNTATQYYAQGDAKGVEEWISMQARSLIDLAYDEKDVELQRRRIINEMQDALADPQRRRNNYLDQHVHVGSPHERWRGGLPEHLVQITIDDIRAYHHNCHRTGNAILITSGTWSHDRACAWADQHLSVLPQGPRTLSIKPKMTICDVRMDDLSIAGNDQMTEYRLLFSHPNLTETERLGLKICNSLTSSKIRDEAADKMGVYGINFEVTEVAAWKRGFALSGSKLSADQVRAVIEQTLKVKRAAIDEITPEAIQARTKTAAKNQTVISAFRYCDPRNRIEDLRETYLDYGDPCYFDKNSEILQSLGYEDVVGSARSILRQTPITFYRGHIRDDFPKGAEIAGWLEGLRAQPTPQAAPAVGGAAKKLEPGM